MVLHVDMAYFCRTSIKCAEKAPRSTLTVLCSPAVAKGEGSEFFSLSSEGERLCRQPHFNST